MTKLNLKGTMSRLMRNRNHSNRDVPDRARLRAVAVAVMLTAVSLVFTACKEKEEVAIDTTAGEKLTLALDYYVNPDHAAIYHGLERGYFSDAGIDLDPVVPTDPSAPIRQVAAGQVDLAISYEPEVLLAREQGLPVVAVAAIVDQPLTSLISLPEAKIREPQDLKGKTVATAGISYQDAFMDAILAEAKLKPKQVKQVDVGLGLLPAVMSGKADAMLGGFRNIEGVDLETRGLKPRVVPVDELGIPTYSELVLVANSEDLEEKAPLISRFIAALGDATYDAIENPKRATAAILDAGDGLEPKLTEAEIRATLPLLLPRDESNPFGYMDADEWREFIDFMYDAELISKKPEVGSVMTTEFLQPAERQ